MKSAVQVFENVQTEFEPLFYKLSKMQTEIREKITKYSDGKILKGNELVGWLGEVYTKIILNGRLVDDTHEHDVETEDGMRVSVKTRKGRGSGWKKSSAIPKIEGADCPTHLMFVHLDEQYLVLRMWLYPWDYLQSTDRFRLHVVRGNPRSFYMSVKPDVDSDYEVYSREESER